MCHLQFSMASCGGGPMAKRYAKKQPVGGHGYSREVKLPLNSQFNVLNAKHSLFSGQMCYMSAMCRALYKMVKWVLHIRNIFMGLQLIFKTFLPPSLQRAFAFVFYSVVFRTTHIVYRCCYAWAVSLLIRYFSLALSLSASFFGHKRSENILS